MNLRTNILVTLLTLVLFSCKEKIKEPATDQMLFSKRVVDYSELLLKQNDTSIKIIDFRLAALYNKGHLQGAVNLHRSEFQDTSFPYKGMRINREAMEKRLGLAGITDKHTLVIYDDKGSSEASRLWWLLQLHNFENVYLLDGGLQYWEQMGGSLSTSTPEIREVKFTFTEQTTKPIVVGKEKILEVISSDASNVFVVDARSKKEFDGFYLKEGAKKAGRIPKSINIDWAEAIDFGNTFTFKSLAELESIYKRIGASKEDTIIVYCHTGVRSSHTTFVLTELLDYKNVMNYDGSWVEWSYFDQLPFENDSLILAKN